MNIRARRSTWLSTFTRPSCDTSPRLTATSVTHVKTDEIELLLRFEITGMLVVNGRPVPVRFSTIIDTDNRVELS